MFKFKLFLQKSFFRLVLLAALCAFVGVFFFALQLEKGNVGPENMRLPSGIEFGKPTVATQGGEAPTSLTIQHLGTREVSQHLAEIIAQSLTFDKDDYRQVVTDARKHFTPSGYAQYSEFLTNSGFQALLNAKDLQAGVYMATPPVELARGVYGGAYKWLFEAPVTMSLIPRGMEAYNKNMKPENRSFILRVQYARVNDPQDPNAVKIELWQVLPPRS